MNLREEFEAGDEQQKANTLEVSRVDLPTYMEFVHGWEVRAHQRPWVTALDALLVAPVCWETHEWENCFVCRVHHTRRLLIVAFRGSGKSRTLIEFAAWAIGAALTGPGPGRAGEGPPTRGGALSDICLPPRRGGTGWRVFFTTRGAEADRAPMFMERGWPTLKPPAVNALGNAVWGAPEY